MSYRVIWKRSLGRTTISTVMMPEGAEVLSAQVQHDEPTLWYACDPGRPLTPRRFAMIGTGFPIPDDGCYVGTVLLDGGTLVLHVFEQVET